MTPMIAEQLEIKFCINGPVRLAHYICTLANNTPGFRYWQILLIPPYTFVHRKVCARGVVLLKIKQPELYPRNYLLGV